MSTFWIDVTVVVVPLLVIGLALIVVTFAKQEKKPVDRPMATRRKRG